MCGLSSTNWRACRSCRSSTPPSPRPERAGILWCWDSKGKAQLEYLYGHLAEVMLSQPATSVWLTTKEPKAGQWVSEFIGKVEVERLRETHFDGTRAGRNFAA